MAGVNITAPPLMEPTDGGLVETGQPVVLKFGSVTSNSERPLWYQLQLAGDARFEQLVHEADRIGWDDEGGGAQSLSADGSHRYEVPVSLETGRAYWWRARAADGANIGPYSDRAKFEIYKPVTVGVPQPRSPIGGVIVAGRQPRFVVTTPQVTGPATQVRIRIEISTSNSFANPVASFSAAIGNDTTAARSDRLSLNTRYHWRARATAEGREGQILGNWSRTSTFRTPATATWPAVHLAPRQRRRLHRRAEEDTHEAAVRMRRLRPTVAIHPTCCTSSSRLLENTHRPCETRVSTTGAPGSSWIESSSGSAPSMASMHTTAREGTAGTCHRTSSTTTAETETRTAVPM